jgi:hypothetical protein
LYAWLVRRVHPTYRLLDVTVAGGVRFTDEIPIPGGGTYRNEGMEYGRIRRGRMTELRVHLDTERVAALDAALGSAA